MSFPVAVRAEIPPVPPLWVTVRDFPMDPDFPM